MNLSMWFAGPGWPERVRLGGVYGARIGAGTEGLPLGLAG